MNWGKGMLLVYVGFVAVILFMVVKSFSSDVDLVAEDYYADELQFQQRIDAETNALHLKDSIKIEVLESSVALIFPAEAQPVGKGEIYFYKASDADADIRMPLQLNAQGVQIVSREKLTKGFYTVKMNWEQSGKSFYVERNIYL